MCAVTSVVIFILQNQLQPEMATMLAQPFQRLTTLGLVLTSVSFLGWRRVGGVNKETLLDLVIVFRVAAASATGTFETGMPIAAGV